MTDFKQRPGVPVPPEELIQVLYADGGRSVDDVIKMAAAWGASEQLRLCVEWLAQHWHEDGIVNKMKAAMRPKPPRLAEKAYVAFVQICKGSSDDAGTYDDEEALVRHALKRLAEAGQPHPEDLL